MIVSIHHSHKIRVLMVLRINSKFQTDNRDSLRTPTCRREDSIEGVPPLISRVGTWHAYDRKETSNELNITNIVSL